jgi:hypothetical protein
VQFDERLRRLVDEAHRLRGTPYFTDACQAIVDLNERRREIEDEELWDWLMTLDPFIRACMLCVYGRRDITSVWQSTHDPSQRKEN